MEHENVVHAEEEVMLPQYERHVLGWHKVNGIKYVERIMRYTAKSNGCMHGRDD